LRTGQDIFRSTALALSVFLLFVSLLGAESFPRARDQSQSEQSQAFQAGKKLYEDGEHKEAIIKFLQALTSAKEKGEIAEACFYLSLSYYALDEKDSCQLYLKRLFEAQPEREIEAKLYSSGYIALFTKEKSQKSQQSEGTKSTSDLAAERVFWESVEKRGTVDFYEAYLKKYPNGYYADLAKITLGELKKKEAEKSGEAGRRKEESFKNYMDSAGTNYQQGNYEKALENIRSAESVKSTKELEDLKTRIDAKLREKERLAQAANFFQTAKNFMEAKDYEAALKAIEQAIKISPSKEIIDFELAVKKVQAGAKAEEQAKQRQYDNYYSQAAAQFARGELEKALVNIHEAKKIKSTDDLLELENKVNDAIEAKRRAAEEAEKAKKETQKKAEEILKKEQQKVAPVEEVSLVQIPGEIIVGYNNKIAELTTDELPGNLDVRGQVKMTLAINEQGNIRVLVYSEKALRVNPEDQRAFIESQIRGVMTGVILDPPKDKAGRAVRVKAWNVGYDCQLMGGRLVLKTIVF